MKKRVLALAVATITAVTMLTGCFSKLNNSNAYDLRDYSAYVSDFAYSGLEIEVEKLEVTDADVQAKIDEILSSSTTYEQVKTGTVADKDSINMDFTGYLTNEDGTKGEAFENGAATGYDYTIGGSFIPSLNDQLIGLEVGKEYDLECVFPDSYPNNPDLAGVTVIFTVTVNYIKVPTVPEYNDEFVATYTKDEYKTVADYNGKIRDDLAAENEATMKSNYQSLLWAQVIENANITAYDEERLAELKALYAEQIESYLNYYAQNFGMTREEFVGSDYCYYFFGIQTEEDVDAMSTDYAKQELDQIMVAIEISKKEKIVVPLEEYQSQAESVVDEYGYDDVADFEENYGRNFFLEGLIADKVNDWMLENNKMVLVEKTTTAETEAETQTETSAN